MKAAFIGSVAFSSRMLPVLLGSDPSIKTAAVFSIPPAHSTPISDYADLAPQAHKASVPHYPFRKINDSSVLAAFESIRPDCTFVLGLSQLLSPELLRLTGLTIGTHPALLPDGRGRAAVPWSILLNWKKSGITFFGITEGIDEGLIYEQESWPITPVDDSETLYEKMCLAGETAFARLLNRLAAGVLVGLPQGTPAVGPLARRRPEDGRIDFSMLAEDIERLIRASARPYPGPFITLGSPWPASRLILWKSGGLTTASAEPGVVIDSGPGGMTIAALGGAVRVTAVEFAGTPVHLRAGDDFSRYFKEGQCLT